MFTNAPLAANPIRVKKWHDVTIEEKSIIMWAYTHDWCDECYILDNGFIRVHAKYEGIVDFKDLSSLREWAGY